MTASATLAMMLAALASNPAGAFDLVCSGVVRSVGKSPPVATSKPLEMRLRIDTTARRACFGPCQTVTPLAALTHERITLVSSHVNVGDVRRESDMFILRATDTLEMHAFDTDAGRADARVPCRREHFSGFPGTPPR